MTTTVIASLPLRLLRMQAVLQSGMRVSSHCSRLCRQEFRCIQVRTAAHLLWLMRRTAVLSELQLNNRCRHATCRLVSVRLQDGSLAETSLHHLHRIRRHTRHLLSHPVNLSAFLDMKHLTPASIHHSVPHMDPLPFESQQYHPVKIVCIAMKWLLVPMLCLRSKLAHRLAISTRLSIRIIDAILHCMSIASLTSTHVQMPTITIIRHDIYSMTRQTECIFRGSVCTMVTKTSATSAIRITMRGRDGCVHLDLAHLSMIIVAHMDLAHLSTIIVAHQDLAHLTTIVVAHLDLARLTITIVFKIGVIEVVDELKLRLTIEFIDQHRICAHSNQLPEDL
jgi:hypothetical protein